MLIQKDHSKTGILGIKIHLHQCWITLWSTSREKQVTWLAAIPWAGELRESGEVILFKNTVTTAAEEMF